MLMPKAEEHAAADCAPPETPVEPETASAPEETAEEDSTHEYVKLNNQFVVPVVEHGRVRSLVILSLSLEVKPGSRERVYELEPRIRDTLLSVLFDHANSGGFSGSFTDAHVMAGLRSGMRSASTALMGEDVKDVLVLDIVRQDVN